MTYHISTAWETIIGLLAIWDLIWRGLALWRAAQKQQKAWYVAILVVNSVGVLPIIYLLTNKEKA
ncbi:MAG TPA: DUF5652 family protein [Candidatus Saccharimonadales bacterium]|nr:DUF5652 family protein [Candidatus Saccharimonadales bacterium]